VPRHGALVWAELPDGLDAGALLMDTLEREGVAYVPGNAFTFDGKGARSGMRLNFSYPNVAQIQEGMTRLGRIFRDAATRRAA
jgi:hypothetical protein